MDRDVNNFASELVYTVYNLSLLKDGEAALPHGIIQEPGFFLFCGSVILWHIAIICSVEAISPSFYLHSYPKEKKK